MRHPRRRSKRRAPPALPARLRSALGDRSRARLRSSRATRAAGSLRLPELGRRHRRRLERARRARSRSASTRRRSQSAREPSGSTNVEDETVSRIDPENTSARSDTIPVGGYPSDVAVGAGAVWVALGPLAELVRVNSDSNEAGSPSSALGAGTPCSGSPRASIAIGVGAVWFVCESPALGRFDIRDESGPGRRPRGGSHRSARARSSPHSPTSHSGSNRCGSSIAARTRSSKSIPSRSRSCARSASARLRPRSRSGTDSLWVANEGDDTVTRVQIPGPRPDTHLDAHPRRGRPRGRCVRRGRGLGRELARPERLSHRPRDERGRRDDRRRQRAATAGSGRGLRVGDGAGSGRGRGT